ncbi:uncharacterized protein BDZ83DRAFT_81249 [Colletotrichum acutatum]|uniref:Rhodopsin domain-containing protein n=1 Tax=Glomerella acutata TaxID=27357 RepID=A0AAD8UB21_GLOAC|nr:uncharacterized protein BDZ83DRAFT_81249 [Colletotrichum acutatum]KAK1713391.1 hypothetical protein BDZ83DRAFT_81249 [Colletotrichum acutatum]
MSEPSFTSANTVAPAATGNLVYLHYVVFGVGYGVSTLLLLLRLYSRYRYSRLRLDDMLVVFSWVFSSAMQILMIVAISMGTMCFPRVSIPDDRFRIYVESQLSYNAAPAFMMSIGCAKASILCLYLETFYVDEWLYKAARITQGVLITITVTITLLLYLSRLPSLSLDAVALFLATAASNIIMDLVLLILPIRPVFRLQTSLGRKLRLTGFFSLGLITTVTSILRLYLLSKIQQSEDLTWDAAPANITSFLEINLLLICACVPAMRQFFRALKPDSPIVNQSTFTNRASGTTQSRLDSSSQVQLRESQDSIVELGIIASRSQSSGAGSARADSAWSEPVHEKKVLSASLYI